MTITIPIHELSFVPKVNDNVEVYQKSESRSSLSSTTDKALDL